MEALLESLDGLLPDTLGLAALELGLRPRRPLRLPVLAKKKLGAFVDSAPQIVIFVCKKKEGRAFIVSRRKGSPMVLKYKKETDYT